MNERWTNNTNNNSYRNSQHVITASVGEHYFHWAVICKGRAHILEAFKEARLTSCAVMLSAACPPMSQMETIQGAAAKP